MQNKVTTVGGEKILSFSKFQFRSNLLFSTYEKQYKKYHINYTFGGHYSLLSILDDLKKKSARPRILLPSYTCSSVIQTVKLRDVDFHFYKLNDDLTPDIQDIAVKCEALETNAILVIDYMGFNQVSSINLLKTIGPNLSDIKIIQDCVHSLCLDNYPIYGDYAYNSFRKILPLEGSLLLSKDPLSINYHSGSNFKFLFYKRLGQMLRFLNLKYNLANVKAILENFAKAEQNYYSTKIFRLSMLKKALISRINLNRNYKTSRDFYSGLLRQFPNRCFGSFDPNKKYYPLGLFMQVENRDYVRAALAKEQIFCPIHWNLPDEIGKEEFAKSFIISERSLTIPLVDIDENKFQHIILSLNKVL